MSQNPITFFPLHAEFASHVPLDWFESALLQLFKDQQGLYWWIGDVMIALEKKYPSDVAYQAIPEGMSLGMCQRCKAVAEAYPPKDRNPLATWSTHMQLAKRADRVAAVAATVEAGQNTDDVKRSPPPPQVQQPPAEPPKVEAPAATEKRWLIAIDMSYYIHSFFNSGAGMDSAVQFARWIYRLLLRLQNVNGLTDAVMCLDAPTNFRKALTAQWEKPYKDRSERDPELIKQLNLAPQLIQKMNVPVVWIEDMEADDVMASYAAQFKGKVTLMTVDKDMRQCLREHVNILREVKWVTQPDTGNTIPSYEWVTAKSHFEKGCPYGTTVTGITPEQWPDFQALAGDSGDDIPGVVGIGGKIAMDLIKEHGTLKGVLDACASGRSGLPNKKLLAVEEFRPMADLMLKLTTLRTDLAVPMVTKLHLPEGLYTYDRE